MPHFPPPGFVYRRHTRSMVRPCRATWNQGFDVRLALAGPAAVALAIVS